jgi:glycosyltransferase involved in cell wall biosynthesis
MSVLYLLTAPQPPMPGTDATYQEISALTAAFNGETINLCPRMLQGQPFPPQLFGFHKLGRIRRLERQCDINHVYHSIPYFFPALRFLKNPIVYTVVTSLRHVARPSQPKLLASLHRIVVSGERDAAILKSWGLSNYAIVRPAVETSRLTRSTLPLDGEMTVLMASAPWVADQFDLKGIDALLEAAANLPWLRLILLWRGVLLEELRDRVQRRGIGDRVEIITGHVDINDYLARAHAAALPAKRGDIVKAYPHSLLESLVAGKPIVLSDALPMADFVRQTRCGVVVDEVSEQSLVQALEQLRTQYDEFARAARHIDPQLFSEKTMVENYRQIYRRDGVS